jgi:hypothetical protein
MDTQNIYIHLYEYNYPCTHISLPFNGCDGCTLCSIFVPCVRDNLLTPIFLLYLNIHIHINMYTCIYEYI